MKTVYKYPINLAGRQTIECPYSYQPLAVQVQNDRPCLWMLVDTETEKTRMNIFVVGTGYPIDHEIVRHGYLGTFQFQGGDLIFHVFEVK